MERRSFLRALGLGAAVLAFDPERLLWVPGARTYFLPSPKTLLTTELIMREALLALERTMLMTAVPVPHVWFQAVAIGEIVRIMKPLRYQQALYGPVTLRPDLVANVRPDVSCRVAG